MTVNRTAHQGKEGARGLHENLKKIDAFKELEQNWNQNNAEPFSETLLDNVAETLLHLIVQPKVFPTARQTIQLEFEKDNGDYLEFEVGVNSTNYLKITGDVEQEEVIASDFTLFNKMIKDFYA